MLGAVVGRPGRKRAMARRQQGMKTEFPGVYRIDETTYRIRFHYVDVRDGKKKEVDRILSDVTVRQAAKTRERMAEDAVRNRSERVKVREFAKLWLEFKQPSVSKATMEKYRESLNNHTLKALGDLYCDAIRGTDVQKWINECLVEGYAVESVHGWFSCFRTMMRDALHRLDLTHDCTQRISFPELFEREERGENALTPEQLVKLLDAFERLAPQHHALVAMLAYTGLRFCHASAIKWEDIDWEKGTITIRRRQVRGDIAPVSRKKRAPRTYPLDAELAGILRRHRERMVASEQPNLDSGWVFLSRTGTLLVSSSMAKTWPLCMKAAGIEGRFTPHGLRRTFNDLARRAGIDGITTRALTGHVTERMQEHYSTVGLDEKRAAIASVVRLVTESRPPVQPVAPSEPAIRTGWIKGARGPLLARLVGTTANENRRDKSATDRRMGTARGTDPKMQSAGLLTGRVH